MAGTVITKKGLQLIAKLVASGTALTFTRASVGIGSIPAEYDPKNMTDLNNYKMDGLISSCSASADEASIIMQISSMGVEAGFTITETGLFATDPDEGEILYAYLDLSKDPQYVYAEDSAISKFVEMTLVVKVGSVERVTAYLNPESLVTRDGNISETVIETLDTVEDKYPVPAAGESVKRFFGKVLTFLRNIRPLTGDINIYVSTTGSDMLGDGTQSNPFKTIQFAINTLPKDFGGYFATLIISPGTYVEDIIVSGFTGTLQFTLLGNVTTGSITIGNARLLCTATAIYTLTIRYLNVVATGRFDSFSSVAITTTDYVVGQPGIGNKSSIVANRGDIYISGPITLTGNTDIGISASAISRIYFSTVSGTGFNIGAIVGTGSVITWGTPNGMSISAITPLLQNGAGVFTYASGTQISGPISTGLACTWGTISGGYYRNGNTGGIAQITINLRITLTQALTAGTPYNVRGLPHILDNSIYVACSVDDYYRTKVCYILNNGPTESMINFIPLINLTPGLTQNFSATYITNV